MVVSVSEDGWLYCWDLQSSTLLHKVKAHDGTCNYRVPERRFYEKVADTLPNNQVLRWVWTRRAPR
jgi:hypothetical protein